MKIMTRRHYNDHKLRSLASLPIRNEPDDNYACQQLIVFAARRVYAQAEEWMPSDLLARLHDELADLQTVSTPMHLAFTSGAHNFEIVPRPYAKGGGSELKLTSNGKLVEIRDYILGAALDSFECLLTAVEEGREWIRGQLL